jgi:single-strand DNA-binding protein
MVNKVFLVGNLGKDPEMRTLPSGKAVATFPLATSRRSRDREGNRRDDTEWHNIVCFDRLAEIAGQYLAKGKMVFIEGRIQTRSWEDRDGKKQYRTEIVCESFQMLGGRGDANRASGAAPVVEEVDSGVPEDDDLPF